MPVSEGHARFADHFSQQSAAYARYRPRYPEQLFDYLSRCCRRHGAALDCAAGSGQAAAALTRHFDHVTAVDGSRRQLAAPIQGGARRVVGLGEALPFRAGSFDLIVVAQALHWFARDRFFAQARQAARGPAILAIWSYRLARVSPAIDPIVDQFHAQVVGPYWPPQRATVDSGLASVEIPFPAIETPTFAMQASWDVEAALGYLSTWSAVQRARSDGKEPMRWIEPRLRALWHGRLDVHWPMTLRVARIDQEMSGT